MIAESVNAAPQIAALFADGAVAYQTREPIAANTLLPEEQQFIQKAVPKRVHEFAGGRACARAALAQLGFGEVALPMNANRAPLWPHTDGFCAAVVATTSMIRALGLDAEPADSVRPHLWHRICTPEEITNLESLDAAAAIEIATLIFSAKEAFYKCQHFLTGEWLGFLDISVTLMAESFTVRPTRSLQITAAAPGPWHGRYLRVGDLVLTGACII